MKKIRFLFILLLVLLLNINGYSDTKEVPSVKKSQCVVCHTSAKSLIKITREIAKGKPLVKHENKGEG